MNTKKCRQCGWEYPIDWKGNKCKFCGGPFDTCKRCHRKSDNLFDGLCKECRTELHRTNRKRHRDNVETLYNEWVEKIKRQPTKTLTEDQWMQACKHFGGCAYCKSPDIEARSMFIQFKDGGRYCAWNIIPACERCETAVKAVTNPFSRMHSILNRDKKSQARKLGQNNLQNIVDYLQSNMEG